MATYKVMVGLEYDGKRVEAGDVVSDIPAKSAPWLKEQKLIVEVAETKPKLSTKRSVDPVDSEDF